jgi:hypothetical protein
MGYYINTTSKGVPLPSCNKADYLILDGATEVKAKFQPNLICVVENAMFDAAGFAYNEEEFDEFNDPNDHRPKRWLVHPMAAKLAGYIERQR